MIFSIHLDDATAAALARAARAGGRTRNAVIRQAIRDWLEKQDRREWPAIVRDFTGDKRVAPFERHRRLLRAPASDPLRAAGRHRSRS